MSMEPNQRSRKSSVVVHELQHRFLYSPLLKTSELKYACMIYPRARDARGLEDSGGIQVGAVSTDSASVVVDQLVEGLRLRVGVLQHPEEVLEEDDLAADDGACCRSPGGAAGAVDEGLE
jgi:hypothetical protein